MRYAILAALAATIMAGGAVAASHAGKQAVRNAAPLAAFADHYPFDRVRGVTFVTHPLVRRAVTAAVPDAAVRTWVLRRSSTAGPIAARGGRLISWACEPHNCGPHHWTILIDPAGRAAEVCYFDESEDGRSRWYAAGRAMQRRPGECPQE
jgi:hypothetical protein